MFITVYTEARHWSLYRARRIQLPLFQPVSLKSILILSSRLRLWQDSSSDWRGDGLQMWKVVANKWNTNLDSRQVVVLQHGGRYTGPA